MTDLAYPLYPEGFYHALVRVGKLGKPVYVVSANPNLNPNPNPKIR
jgi:hypothetical protein